MLLSREQIQEMIPHGASMSMLDEVVAWDRSGIHCRSRVLAADNAMWPEGRDGGDLPSTLLVEYAAQAAAVHAALLSTGLGEAGSAYLGSLKNLDILQATTSGSSPLEIHGQCEMSGPAGAIYPFTVSQNDVLLIQGRLLLSRQG